MFGRLFLIVLACWLLTLQVKAEEIVRVAVASNFSAPIKEIAKVYSNVSDDKIRISFGSSGKIFAQIRHGAPFDIFLSADNHKTEELKKLGLVADGSNFTYAEGKIVLWSRNTSLVDDQGLVLANGDFSKLAMANPKLAPYGKAAEETLQSLGLLYKLRSRLVKGENISQTFQFVESGNAQLGFIALSQIVALDKISLNLSSDDDNPLGSMWRVPENLYLPIRQDAVLLKSAMNKKAANEFYRFLKSAEARKIIESYGYSVSTKVEQTTSNN